nr:hypothetical protein [Candidatus Sigynarchaeota archaeon]
MNALVSLVAELFKDEVQVVLISRAGGSPSWRGATSTSRSSRGRFKTFEPHENSKNMELITRNSSRSRN